MMKKIVMSVFIFVVSSLWAEVFIYNTDVKAKYEFDMTQAAIDAEMADMLERFQSGEVSEEEIQTYLDARDKNTTQSISDDDIMIDKSLQGEFENNTTKASTLHNNEESWFTSLYNRFFSDKKEEIQSVDINDSNESNDSNQAEGVVL